MRFPPSLVERLLMRWPPKANQLSMLKWRTLLSALLLFSVLLQNCLLLLLILLPKPLPKWMLHLLIQRNGKRRSTMSTKYIRFLVWIFVGCLRNTLHQMLLKQLAILRTYMTQWCVSLMWLATQKMTQLLLWRCLRIPASCKQSIHLLLPQMAIFWPSYRKAMQPLLPCKKPAMYWWLQVNRHKSKQQIQRLTPSLLVLKAAKRCPLLLPRMLVLPKASRSPRQSLQWLSAIRSRWMQVSSVTC